MFGTAKPAFGQATNTFGFNSSPFGASSFGKPAFGSAFGAPAAAPAGGLFGAAPPAQPQAGLFGAAPPAQTPFGAAPPAQNAFGFGQNTSGGLFGSPQPATSLFGQNTPAAQPFGAKPQGFGFGATSTAPVGGLFGSTAPAAGGLFGSPQPSSSGLFGANAGFGVGASNQTGTCIKYNPVSGSDVMVKNGLTQNINTLHHCITSMKEYEARSLEELRLEDYAANRKGGALGGGPGAFGQPGNQPTAPGGMFNQPDKPLFGQTNTAFGQPSTSSAGGLFGKPATTGFGAQPNAGTGFSFGANTSTQAAPLFGAPKPFSAPGVFGAPATTGAQSFSTGFGAFGAPQQQTNSLFGAKPAEAPAFGMPQTTSAGGFGVFGANPGAQNPGGLFGAKPAATPFGAAAPAFGAANTGFGAPQANAGGGLFGNSAFGAKPATTGAPAFGGFNPAPAATAMGGGLNMGGGGVFGAKPGGGGVFGAKPGGGLFGGAAGAAPGGLFGGGAMPTNLGSTLNTGNTGFGVGLGFGQNTGGGLGLGGGLNTANNQLGTNTSLGFNSMPANSTGGSIHEHMMALACKPYGFNSLFNDLTSSPAKADEISKPTNPIAQKPFLESDRFKVSPGVSRLRVKPISAVTPISKKSLFDGLEEDDPSVQQTLTLKPSCKRLVLRPKAPPGPGTGPGASASSPLEDSELQKRNESGASDLARSADDSRGDVSLREDSGRDVSPSIIQRRVGLSDPRGSVLQTISSADTSEDSDRRSSWLKRKPLDTWVTSPTSSLDNTVEQLLPRARGGLYPDLTRAGLVGSDLQSLEDESRDERDKENHSPHPTGIKLTRAGYYTIPSMDELIEHISADGMCVVPQFTIGRRGYGNVFYDCEMDVSGLDIDNLVHIMNKEIVVYPEDDAKPDVGQGLNRKAQVTLDKVWPMDKTMRQPITDPERLATMDYEAKLRRACDKIGTKFIEYRPQTGSWVFKVQHFSKYGLTESDEEDDAGTSADPRQRAAQTIVLRPAPNRGLGGTITPGGILSSAIEAHQRVLESEERTMDGEDIPKGLAMDTSEDNSVDTMAFYPDGDRSSIFGTKDMSSPTSIHMDMRSSHTLQLMKASFYNMENDMDDARSSGDQLVPQGLLQGSSVATSTVRESPSAMDATVIPSGFLAQPARPELTGVQMKAPIVKPQTVMLRFHRRIQPFSKTIAGRLGASCYSDLSIANARHFRVGWGRGSQLTCLTTVDAVADASLAGDLAALSGYVSGRGGDDTSAAVTQRLRIAGGGPPTDIGISFKESIERHLEIVLSMSELVSGSETSCPRYVPTQSKRRAMLEEHLEEDRRLDSRIATSSQSFGVGPKYWKQVWSLCLALWGDHSDTETDSDCGSRLLAEHASLSAWLQRTLAEEQQDEERNAGGDDRHPELTPLLAARRLREACRMAQRQGNHFLAALLTQVSGDASTRTLAYNQCAALVETGAASHVPPGVLSCLCLLSGRARLELAGGTLHACEGLPWLGALALHFWYICEPVATVGDALRGFAASFWEEAGAGPGGAGPAGLREAGEAARASSRVALPLPRHRQDQLHEDDEKRCLDLRYQLMCLRDSKWCPLDSILNPDSHTPDPLDYRLSWLLQQFLHTLGYSHWSPRGLATLNTGFAAQLEAHGLWPWAVFVLQHIENDALRSHAVKEMVLRHAGGTENTPTAQLLHRLGVPQQWLHLAEAQKSKYLNDPENEARHLTLAERWTEAHSVILDTLAPNYVLNDNAEALRNILKALTGPGEQGLIPHWATGGKLYLEFLDIWEEVKSLVGLSREEFSYRCESLKPRIAVACSAISNMPTPSPQHTVARWEVGARSAQAGCAVVGHPESGRVERMAAGPLLAVVGALDLPPDYTRLLLDKLVDSLSDGQEVC